MAATVLAVSIGVVYGRALDVPFIFDDRGDHQKSVDHFLWPFVGAEVHPRTVESAARTADVAADRSSICPSRSNYFFDGLNPTGYHAVNVRDPLSCRPCSLGQSHDGHFDCRILRGDSTDRPDGSRLAVAMLWALHPLQTEAVIYATQRTEFMLAFFYLATLLLQPALLDLISPPS